MYIEEKFIIEKGNKREIYFYKYKIGYIGRLFIGGLPLSTSIHQLEAALHPFGSIGFVNLIEAISPTVENAYAVVKLENFQMLQQALRSKLTFEVEENGRLHKMAIVLQKVRQLPKPKQTLYQTQKKSTLDRKSDPWSELRDAMYVWEYRG